MEKENNVYVISLDALDLNSLPISQRHSDGGVVPLWSVNYLESRKNGYHEFVIKTDDTEEDLDLDLDEPVIENVTCNICDVNVPKVYLNKHENGFRHEFNRKVAHIEMGRPQFYVNDKNNKKLHSKYYCNECSIVIDREDEATHKQTLGHRNSVLLERLLKYALNDGNEKANEDVETIVSKEIENSKQDNVTNKPKTVHDAEINSKKQKTKTKIVKETKKDVNFQQSSNSDEQINILNPQRDLNDGKVLFKIKNGSKVNTFVVDGIDYDAIVDLDDTYYCMMCNATLLRQNIYFHVAGARHEQNLRQKSLDKNCVRKLNSCRHHCVLCRDYFKEYDPHVHSAMHLKNFRDKIVNTTTQGNDNFNKLTESSTDVNKKTAPVYKEHFNGSTSSGESKKTVKHDPNLHFCDVCQVRVPNNDGTIKLHCKGRSHIQNLKNAKAVISTKVVTTSNSYNQMIKTSNINTVTCVLCDVNLTYNDRDITTHIQDLAHKDKYEEFVSRNYIVYRNDNPFCTVCQVQVGTRNEFAHSTGKNHMKNLEKILRNRRLR